MICFRKGLYFMKENITRDFNGAEEKGLTVYYDENSAYFEIETPTEVISFYDEENEARDGSNGEAAIKVQKFIDEF